MQHSPSESNQFYASKEIPTFYWTRKLFTAFKCARHLSLFWSSSIQSILQHPISLRCILPSMPPSPKWSLSLKISPPNGTYV